MKRVLALMAVTGVLLLLVGGASAEENPTGKASPAPRGGLQTASSPTVHTAAADGTTARYAVSDSMARWHSGRPSPNTPSLGVGGEGMFDNKAAPKDGFRPHDKELTALGGSVPLSKSVSLKAAGRFENLGSVSGKGGDGPGGNLGLKISF